MDEEKKFLEKKFLYRIVKVNYVLAFIFFGFIVFIVGWNSKPEEYIDEDKSHLTCTNGKKYALNSSKIYLFSSDSELSEYDDERARKVCAYAIVDDYLNKYKTPESQNYQVTLVNSIRGSWGSAVMWWTLGLGGVYIVLNLIKETLLYVFLGKKFSWRWLQDSISFFNK